MTRSRRSDDGAKRDLLAHPLSAVLLWGLPLATGATAGLLHLSGTLTATVWAVALAWMGMGCALNARRCHRLHCYLAGPILFLGAVAVAAVAFGFAPLGPRTASYVIDASLGLALLTFLVEAIWGKYRRERPG